MKKTLIICILALGLLSSKEAGPTKPKLSLSNKDVIEVYKKDFIRNKFKDKLHTMLLKEVSDSAKRKNIVMNYTEKAVIDKIKDISEKFSIKPIWLMRVIIKESGGYPNAVNPKSNATGIIQWMPSTAKYLGTSVDNLKQMSIVEQLYYVEKYLHKVTSNYNINSYENLYLSVFYPKALGKSDNYIIGNNDKVVAQNKTVDFDNDGIITKNDFKNYALN